MTTVLLAEDHDMFREMMRVALSRHHLIDIVGEARSGQEALSEARRLRPDVVLLDYKMPEVENFEVLVQQIRSIRVRTEVVVLTGYRSAEVAFEAARGGALGYVLKSTPLATMANAVLTAARGEAWVDRAIGDAAIEAFKRGRPREQDLSGKCDHLTRRERDVLTCAARGCTNGQIAADLGISEETVKTHMAAIFSKLQVRNRLAAVLAFTEQARV